MSINELSLVNGGDSAASASVTGLAGASVGSATGSLAGGYIGGRYGHFSGQQELFLELRLEGMLGSM